MTALRPRYDAFLREYDSSTFEDVEGARWVDLNRERHYLTLRAFARLRPELPRELRILDVGSYPGTLLRLLRSFLGEEGTLVGAGLGAPEGFAESLRAHGIRFVRCNLDPAVAGGPPDVPATLPDEPFDVVFATEVLEHLLSPFHMLAEIRRVLAPGGRLILTTPNQATLTHRLRLLAGKSVYYPLRESFNDWRPHFREYTMEELMDLMKRAGFTVERREYLEICEDDHGLVRGGSAGRRLFKAVQKRVLDAVPSFRHGLLVVARP